MLRLGTDKDVARLHNSFWNRDESFFTWGNEALDTALPLLGQNQLVILAGTQGSGKTTWSMELALANAVIGKEQGFSVGYLALEVSPENILKRMIERRLGISKEDRRKGAIFLLEQIEEKKKLSLQMFNDFINSGLMFFQPDDLKDNPYHINSIRKFCEDPYSPKLLIIDNLAEIQSDEKDEYSKIDNILRTLSDIRKHTDTTIVLLHHMAKPRINEPLSINSIKGNNITVTKADVTVAIDKCNVSNFNWECHWKDADGNLVDKATLKKFYSYAPKIQVRSIYSFKDRYYSIEGLLGYMELDQNGNVEFLCTDNLKDLFPLSDKQKEKLQAAYDKFKLLPPLKPEDMMGAEEQTTDLFPW